MKVKRIVTNIPSSEIDKAKLFYADLLGMEVLMNQGWITTYGSAQEMAVQISFASEGGSGTPVPDLSIEVDDVDTAYQLMQKHDFKIEYRLTNEPWGVRRFFVRDPFGKLVNILTHI